MDEEAHAAAIELLEQSLETDLHLTLSGSEMRLETDDGAVAVFELTVTDFVPGDDEISRA